MTLALLPDEAEVFRLVSHNSEHFPPDAPKPHPQAFVLTKDDEAEGARRNLPPMLSVFDHSKTSPAQGRKIRQDQATQAGRVASEMTPFGWSVATIRSIMLDRDTYSPRLSVVSDPLGPEAGPGGDGHAGIVGLDGIKGEQGGKEKRKLLRLKLVDACHRIAEISASVPHATGTGAATMPTNDPITT